MAKEYLIAWTIYTAGTLVLLAAGWWFMRKWKWVWLRRLLLAVSAAVLLGPARPPAPEAVAVPVLPLFVYQTLFEEEGAAPDVTANLLLAFSSALALVAVWGLIGLYIAHRRDKRRGFREDPYFNE